MTVEVALMFVDDVVTSFMKFKVAAWLTVRLPILHAAVFDHVPVPLKNTEPKVFPPELMVFNPLPRKYTFMEVVHEPCKEVNNKLPYRFRLLAEEVDAKFGVLVVTVQYMFTQLALAKFNVTVWFGAENELLVK